MFCYIGFVYEGYLLSLLLKLEFGFFFVLDFFWLF